jgi:hypothetical protein
MPKQNIDRFFEFLPAKVRWFVFETLLVVSPPNHLFYIMNNKVLCNWMPIVSYYCKLLSSENITLKQKISMMNRYQGIDSIEQVVQSPCMPDSTIPHQFEESTDFAHKTAVPKSHTPTPATTVISTQNQAVPAAMMNGIAWWLFWPTVARIQSIPSLVCHLTTSSDI